MISFIDRMIAASEASFNTIEIPVDRPLKSEAEILDYVSQKLSELLEEAISKVIVDVSLTNPKKLAKFASLSSFSKQACLSYFALRRCVEHHNSVPLNNIRLLFRRLIVYVAGKELVQLPHIVEAGGQVSVQLKDHYKDFEKGKPVELSEDELEQIVLSIKAVIAPEIASVAASALNRKVVAEGTEGGE